MPFVRFNPDHNNNPEFSFGGNRERVIFNRNCYYFYDEQELNKIGIFATIY